MKRWPQRVGQIGFNSTSTTQQQTQKVEVDTNSFVFQIVVFFIAKFLVVGHERDTRTFFSTGSSESANGTSIQSLRGGGILQ